MSYISSTDPNPFHQLIVLSQKTINDAFKNMWSLAQLDDESPLTHFKEKLRSGDYLDTDIGIPSVQLQVTTKDPMLYFMLRMTSGTLFLYLTEDPDNDSHIEWPINDWVFAFSVTLARKEITKDSDEYKKFKDRAGLPNSTFSLAKLFIDASSTTKWDPDLSDFGDREQDFKNLTPEARATFTTFIQKWLNIMNEKGCNILGYSALDDGSGQLNTYEPTFPPTSVDYDCYPWRSNSWDTDQDNQDTNALCYLMMSKFESAPSKTLSYSGQFIDSSHDATFVMNRSLFWPWMFSVLRNVVIDMIPVPDTPYLEWDNTDPAHPYVSSMKYHFGDWTCSASDYSFIPAGPGSWTWGGRPLSSSNSVSNPNNSNDYETINEWANVQKIGPITIKDACGGALSFQAGGDRLTLDGKSTFILNVQHISKHDTHTTMTFTLTWSIDIGMAAIEDGGLVFNVTSTNTDVQGSQDGDLSWNPPVEQVEQDFQEALKNNMDNAIQRAENDLQNALANQHRLFLPAVDIYLMKDPVFNNKGDLMVGLTYNGADPPSPPQH
ncbi:hypothetical protein FOBRF1_013303 [Fusarium oxysporum]